jgi:hypothetical protein
MLQHKNDIVGGSCRHPRHPPAVSTQHHALAPPCTAATLRLSVHVFLECVCDRGAFRKLPTSMRARSSESRRGAAMSSTTVAAASQQRSHTVRRAPRIAPMMVAAAVVSVMRK